jgi:hypothetical protein
MKRSTYVWTSGLYKLEKINCITVYGYLYDLCVFLISSTSVHVIRTVVTVRRPFEVCIGRQSSVYRATRPRDRVRNRVIERYIHSELYSYRVGR